MYKLPGIALVIYCKTAGFNVSLDFFVCELILVSEFNFRLGYFRETFLLGLLL